MNKKFLSVAMSVFMVFSMIDVAFAAKKDVADPVLQQIITELSDRMPRFINKYGVAVFVADEQITRGALLQALYEFDKKSSSSKVSSSVSSAGVISKKDYDALNAKVLALEKKMKIPSGSTSGGSSAEIDIVQLMNDLEPNMPMMLDNSLSSSKKFKELEAKVKAVTSGTSSSASAGSASNVSQTAIAGLQKDINELNAKINNVELSLASAGKTDKSGSSATNAQVLYEIKNFKSEINAVNKKVSDMEVKLESAKGTSSVSSSPSKEEINSLKKTLVQMQQSYVSLGKRLDNMEKEQSIIASSSSSGASPNALSASQMKLINSKINSIREEVDNIKVDSSRVSGDKSSADIEKIEKRLSNLEKTDKSETYSSDSGSSKTSTVAKVSLGLSLVAALFIAR